MSIFICCHCGRETTNAGANKKHENSCLSNPNPKKYKRSPNAGTKKGSVPWNKGLTKDNDPRVAHSQSTKIKISEKSKLQKHTEETKQKISRARRKYLTENPDKVPYKLNHYSKGPSYPERYWKKIFDNVGLKYVEQYQIHIYQLDFALVEEKIDIEIDGDQHYLDKRIVESDKRRNDYLENLGWKVIRIRWSEYKKLVDKQDRMDYVNSIMIKIMGR